MDGRELEIDHDFHVLAISDTYHKTPTQVIGEYTIVQFIGNLIRQTPNRIMAPTEGGQERFLVVAVRSSERNDIIKTMRGVEEYVKALYASNPSVSGAILGADETSSDTFTFITRRINNALGSVIVP